MAIGDLLPSVGGDELALTSSGIHEAVNRHVSIESPDIDEDDGVKQSIPPEAKAKAKAAVRNVLEHLIVRGETDRDALIEAHFDPNPPMHRRQLRFSEWASDEWWQDVIEPALRELPCVEPADSDSKAWRFKGVAASDYDDEHVVPLAELRSDPDVAVEATLDDRGVDRDSLQREAVRSCWRHLQANETATSADLDETLHQKSIDGIADDLAALPGVEREVESLPDPEEIAVETMADVLEGYERLESDPVEVWRYDAGEA